MFCDQCGATLTAGTQFCVSCGKAVAHGSLPAPAPPAVQASTGRVQRHLTLLASLWAVRGALRLIGVIWILIAGQIFLPFIGGWAGGEGWPFSRNWPFDFLAWGLYSTAIVLGFFGVLYLVLAWGLFQRQPWARFLGLVLGFLSLIRIPFGTALGIYTLWVLLPEPSGQEYERLCRAYQQRPQVSA
jgi:hypothetical protein